MKQSEIRLYDVTDPAFIPFGRVIEFPFYDEMQKAMENIDMPAEGTAYIPAVEAFETKAAMDYYGRAFGELPIQIGLCCGYNTKLNALEWHKSSEIVCALTDLILMLGEMRHMENGTFDTANIKYFLMKAGQSVEMYQTSLHFCPVHVGNTPFANLVILPKGTNTNLTAPSDDPVLIRKNKWLICHKDAKNLVDAGRVVGVTGENPEITE